MHDSPGVIGKFDEVFTEICNTVNPLAAQMYNTKISMAEASRRILTSIVRSRSSPLLDF